ncbi:MAG: hypothetical protein AB8B57_15940 [Congregibacter sp.]
MGATGHGLTSGFIDRRTHTYGDGQLSGDVNMPPSINPGVSAVAMGGCGGSG